MTNALVVPLLVLLGSGVLGALVYGPIRTGLPRHTAEVRQRVRRISGADSVAHRQRRIIRAIATGVPRLADQTARSRVLPPAVRVELHPSDLEPFLRIRERVEEELNEDWAQQAIREDWFCPDVVAIDAVVSDGLGPGQVRLHLRYDAVDDPTPDVRKRPARTRPGRGRATSPTAEQRRSAWLSDDAGQRLWLGKVGTSVLVGRGRDCDFVVGHEFASKKHVELVVRADGVLVRDLGSTNYTYVDEQRIGETLVRGDAEIRLGKSEPLHLTWS